MVHTIDTVLAFTPIGDYALFLGKASIEIKIEEKDYLIVSQSAILILIRDDIGRVLA